MESIKSPKQSAYVQRTQRKECAENQTLRAADVRQANFRKMGTDTSGSLAIPLRVTLLIESLVAGRRKHVVTFAQNQGT